MTISELEQKLLQLSSSDKRHIIQLLTESLQSETEPETPEYPLAQFYGCIQDETFFRHPQAEQPEREAI
ncbi:MAG: hypothetical protein IGS23_05415 [Rivularia sp. T60_A2020_040]|nr:hypothetical protein [Rivularia sp. T60_A2020_040]